MATFPTKIEYARQLNYAVSLRALETQFGDGYRQRARDGINTSQQNWRVTTVELDEKDFVLVDAFLKAEAGNFFDWTPPLATESVSVSCDRYEVQYVGGSTLKRISAEFVQTFG